MAKKGQKIAVSGLAVLSKRLQNLKNRCFQVLNRAQTQ
jgi:hypothetical protein